METGLSLGCNLGDRLANLCEARRQVGALPGIELLASGSVYETEPVDVRPVYADLPFLNSVIIVESSLNPSALGVRLRHIEERLGRRRSADRNAPRPIDIDVLYAGTLILDDDDMTVPHPRWCSRRFVVQPLADVRPGIILPGYDRSVAAILAALPPEPAVDLFTQIW